MERQVHASKNGSTCSKRSIVTCQWWNFYGYMDGNDQIFFNSVMCTFEAFHKIFVQVLKKKHRSLNNSFMNIMKCEI